MKQIICNSSPIIALFSIKQLSLLPELFDAIYVPHAVYTEVTRGSESAEGVAQLGHVLQSPPFQLYQVETGKRFIVYTASCILVKSKS